MTAIPTEPIAQPRKTKVRLLPYLLSLPALLICIGILIPFVTAVYYSLLRYRLNMPMTKGFIWFDNYINFLSDSEFWHTVSVSLLYTGLTVGVEVLLGLLIAILLRRVATALPTYFDRVRFVTLIGVTAAVLIDVGDVTWWHIDWQWKLYQAFYDVSFWFLTGLVLGLFVKARTV